MVSRKNLFLPLVVWASLAFASAAPAAIVASGSKAFTEPNGLYSGVKSFVVYTHDDVGNPAPGAPGELTYVYTLSNDPGSNIAIIGLNMDAPVGSVVAAGFVDDADLTTPPPAATVDNNDGVVRWDWLDPNLINPGQTADAVYVISAFTPGGVNDTIYSVEGNFAFDVEGTCVGPLDPPVETCELQIEKEGCVVQPVSPPGDACEGKLKCFSFEYTGLGCDASSNLQDPKKTLCLGGADGADPVDIIVTGNKHKKRRHGWWGWWNKRKSTKTFASFKDVAVGDVVEVCAGHGGKHNFGSSTKVKIKDASGGYHDVLELDKFHTSCSQPFGPGMQFGSVKVTSVTSTKGGTVDLPEDPPDEMCVTEIDVTEPPHCVGKITSLTLRYLGGDCSDTMNGQSAGAQGCVDFSPAGTFPVRLIVSDGEPAPPQSNVYVDASPVEIGDLVTIDASDAGHSNLKGVTGFWIKSAGDDTLRSDGYFHTSCSEPLNLGDQFGPLQIYSITRTQGGTASLEHEVEYTYTVTNPNADDATDVSVDDDILGNIVSGETVPGGGSAVYTTTALVSEETTNVATVTGSVGAAICEPASAEATITVAEPPPPAAICSTKVEAMRLLYTGPDILGARVELRAANFWYDEVVYDPIDLIGGVTELSLPEENGFSIDATAHHAHSLGHKTLIKINGAWEKIDTSCHCSQPFETGKPAPLFWSNGTSDNWTVVGFTQKD